MQGKKIPNPSARLEQRFYLELVSNNTMIPDMLLASYEQLGLTDSELVWLIRALKLRKDDGYIDVADMTALTGKTAADTGEYIAALEGKGIISAPPQQDKLNLDGLFVLLFDLWAFSQMASSCKKPKPDSAEQPPAAAKTPFSRLYRMFEKEFGRCLSPIENEKLAQWLSEDKQPAPMIEEALKRAVLNGKTSFAYIDKILLSWRRQGLHSLQEVLNGDNVQQPDLKKPTAKNPVIKTVAAKKPDYSSVYDKMLK